MTRLMQTMTGYAPMTFAALLLALTHTGAAHGQFTVNEQTPQRESAERYAQVRLLADRASIALGDSFHLVVAFDIEPGWHIYWRNPGVGPAAPFLRVNAAETFAVGAPRWPRPKVIESEVGEMFAHEERAAVFIPIGVPYTLSGGAAMFTVEIGYAVCDHRRCFFGRTTLPVSVDVNKFGGKPVGGETAAMIETHRMRLPRIVDQVDAASAEIIREGSDVRLVVTAPAHGFNELSFFHLNSPGVTYSAPEVTFEEGHFRAVIDLLIEPVNFTRGAPTVGGVIALGAQLDDPSYEFELPLQDEKPVSLD